MAHQGRGLAAAGLVLLGYFLARQNWKVFLPLMAGLILLTVHSLHSSIELPFVSRFLYEINKYTMHESSELLGVRIGRVDRRADPPVLP